MWFDPDRLIVCCDETADDELCFRRAARRAGLACDLRFFSQGSEAYHFLKTCEAKDDLPSVIFVRYQLKDCSGQQLIKFIRDLPSFAGVPIVFLTSPDSDAPLFEGAAPAGANIVYEKLISPETFTEVEELLRHAAGEN